jgi:hypothetical protein
MKVPQSSFSAFTRRVFCRTIAGAASTSVLGALAADLRSLPEGESTADDYVVVNGWVLTGKDALLRQKHSGGSDV